MIRYLLELSVRTDWSPIHATVSNYISTSYSVVSVFDIGVPETPNYWTNWGGTYDNPTAFDLEVYFGEFLQRVETIESLLSVVGTFLVMPGKCLIHLPKYVWQYWRNDLFLRETVGYSSAVRDIANPSDNTYDGIPYIPRLMIPTVGASSLPDPINSIVIQDRFNCQLINNDGLFDDAAKTNFFNTPATLKKSTVENPSLSDFEIIRTGFVEDQDLSMEYFKVKIADRFRSFSQEVCKIVSVETFPFATKNLNKPVPVFFGICKKVPLVELADDKWLIGDPGYIESVVDVFDDDGVVVSGFSYSDGVVTYSGEQKPKTATVQGCVDCRVGDIIVSEITAKSTVPYTAESWDLAEVEFYRSVSTRIGLYFSGGDLKKLITECLKNDSAHFFTKNDGRLTIRRWGSAYNTHVVPSWLIMDDPQKPQKTHTEQKYFSSSVAVQYDYDYAEKTALQTVVDDSREQEITIEYAKEQRLTYETKIIDGSEANDLASRMMSRQGRRSEIVSLAVGYDTSRINPIDTVVLPIDINGRKMSQFTRWTVRSVDPSQDVLMLEQFSGDFVVSGILSHLTIDGESGEMCHNSSYSQSGTLTQPYTIMEE